MKSKWSKIVGLYLGSLVTVFILCSSPQRAEAAVLAEYLFNSSTGASTDGNNDSTANAFGAVNLTTSYLDPNYNGTDSVSFRATAGSMPAAPLAIAYFTFTITPTAGNQLMMSGNAALTFEYARTDTGNFNQGKQFNWAVRSSVDSFGSDVATGATAAGAIWYGASVDLPSAFDNQAAAVEFRFLVWDNGVNAPTDFGFLDNVVLNGSVTPVPEPVNVALGVFGLCVAGAGVGRRLYLRAHS